MRVIIIIIIVLIDVGIKLSNQSCVAHSDCCVDYDNSDNVMLKYFGRYASIISV